MRVRGDRVWGSRRIYCARFPKRQTWAVPVRLGSNDYRCIKCGERVKVVR